MQGYCSSRSAVAKFRGEAVYVEFMKQWNVGVYFSLRFQEIAGALDSALAASSLVPFRGTLIRQQKERSERNKQAIVDALVNSGASIRARCALLWEQQMERRRQLAQLGYATGVYKTLVKHLVGVPQVLLDFVRTINDDDGLMKEQRKRYGPPYTIRQL